MIFSRELTIPANTSIFVPVRTVLPICRGLVKHVWVRWHWGSANLCGARGLYRTFAQWPLAIGEWFRSTVIPMEFEEDIVCDQAPLEIVLEGYNLDDTYPHSVWFGFNVVKSGNDLDTAAFIASLRTGE